MDVARVPETLCSAERASHLARALQRLLLLPLPPEALPPLSDLAGVICLEACGSSEALADGLGTEPASARQGGPTV